MQYSKIDCTSSYHFNLSTLVRSGVTWDHSDYHQTQEGLLPGVATGQLPASVLDCSVNP